MGWLRAHWKASLIGAVLFSVGVGIGAAGNSSETTSADAAAKTVTARGDDVTVTTAETVTSTKTVTTKAAPPASSQNTQSSGLKTFTGNGGKSFRVQTEGGTLRWTNDGDLFQIYDEDFNWAGVNSEAHSGTSFIPQGSYTLTVNALGSWTIKVPR
jgi:hypothetical protein